jgi:hypothetical protein
MVTILFKILAQSTNAAHSSLPSLIAVPAQEGSWPIQPFGPAAHPFFFLAWAGSQPLLPPKHAATAGSAPAPLSYALRGPEAPPQPLPLPKLSSGRLPSPFPLHSITGAMKEPSPLALKTLPTPHLATAAPIKGAYKWLRTISSLTSKHHPGEHG